MVLDNKERSPEQELSDDLLIFGLGFKEEIVCMAVSSSQILKLSGFEVCMEAALRIARSQSCAWNVRHAQRRLFNCVTRVLLPLVEP